MNMIFAWIAVGLASGLIGGLLGIGGGVVAVPALYYLLQYFGHPEEHLMQMAVATSLASACFSTFGASVVQFRHKAILFSVLRLLIPGLIIGSIFGVVLAYFLPTESLRSAFALAIILLGPYFFFPKLPSFKIASNPNRSLSYVAITIGTVSSLLGVGGGVFTIPILLGYQVPAKNAVGTSSASTFITSLLASLSFLLLAWNTGYPARFGFIDPVPALTIGLSSLFSAPIGAYLSLTLPTAHLKRFFGSALVATGLFMLFN